MIPAANPRRTLINPYCSSEHNRKERKMKKSFFHRALCALIALCTLMLFLPVSALTAMTAQAASGSVEYELEVNGVRVTSSNASDILGNGNFRYVNATKTLYMKGYNDFKAYDHTSSYGTKYYTLRSIRNIGIIGLTICVEEDAILKGKILCYADTRITGPGKLVLTNSEGEERTIIDDINTIESRAMFADITIENADVNSDNIITGLVNGLYLNLTVINSHVRVYKIKAHNIKLQGCHFANAAQSWPEIVIGDLPEKPTKYGIRILYNLSYWDVTENNFDDILGSYCDDGKFRYNPLDNTLYVSGNTDAIIFNDSCTDLTIMAEGTASVEKINLYTNTTITGENKLSVSYGTFVINGTLTIQDAQFQSHHIQGLKETESIVQRLAIKNSFVSTEGAIGDFTKLTVTDCYIENPAGAEVGVKNNLYAICNSSGNYATNIRIVLHYDKYGFSYNGQEVTALNVTEIFGENASYSPTENMLTVTGSLEDNLVNDSNDGLIINLAGRGTRNVGKMDNISTATVKAPKFYADTTIIGSGVLTGATHVYNGAKLTFDHASVYAGDTVSGNSTQESIAFDHSEVYINGYLLNFKGGITFDGCSMIAPNTHRSMRRPEASW